MFSTVPLLYYQYGRDSLTRCALMKSAWRDSSSNIYQYYQPSFDTRHYGAHSSQSWLTRTVQDSKPNISKTLKFGIDNILSTRSYKDSTEDERNHLPFPVVDYCKPPQRRRPWSRPVFTQLQRRGLEKRFQVQKYITKHDRYQLAAMLGLSETQVKVWFQNRRTKWRQDMKDSERSNDDKEDQDTDAKDDKDSVENDH